MTASTSKEPKKASLSKKQKEPAGSASKAGAVTASVTSAPTMPVSLAASGLLPYIEGLKLNESEQERKLASLAALKTQSSRFESSFFELFVPGLTAKSFQKASWKDRRTACALLSPVVVDSILKMMLGNTDTQPLWIESVVLALILSGAVSLYRHSRLMDILVAKEAVEALVALLTTLRDVPDGQTVQLLLSLVQNDVLRARFDAICGPDNMVLTLLAKPKSPILLKKYFLTANKTDTIKLFGLVKAHLTAFDELAKTRNEKPEHCFLRPSRQCLIDWMSLLVDSQYPLALLQPDLLEAFKSALEVVKDEMAYAKSLERTVPMIKALPTIKKFAQDRDSTVIAPGYSIEMSDL